MLFEISNIWLFASGCAAGLVCLIHFVLGGKEIAKPLLASQDMHSVAKYTNYYCWHLVTITLFAMCLGLVLASIWPDQWALAYFWVAIAAAFAVWNIALVLWKRQSPWLMPQWIMFLTVAGLGIAGLV